jgi:EAL domain-containing protein (putative c-di-GMP-specific phosphodiesterase class I)
VNISFLEIIDYLKKNILVIIVTAILSVGLGVLYVNRSQSYVASTTISYVSENAKEGKDENGKDLDVYGIMSPAIIEKATRSLGLSANVEQIRSAMSVTPLVDSTTQTKNEALADKGEDVEFFPTDYTVSFTHNGRFGAQYGIQLVNKILEYYDEYIRETQTNVKKIPDSITDIDYNDYDYMQICELYQAQMQTMLDTLSSLNTQAPDFRSAKTGLTFNDIMSYVQNIQKTEYAKLYSYVRKGLLTKNQEILLKSYQYKVQELSVVYQKKLEESNSSYNILVDFYKNYKEGQQVNNDFTGKDSNNTTNNIVTEERVGSLTTTYDTIITRYIDSGVESKTAECDMAYYNTLINDFQNDSVSQEVKNNYSQLADGLITKMGTVLGEYIEMANETIDSYNVYKGTEFISYLSSVSTKAQLSSMTILLFAVVLGVCLGVIIAVCLEIMKKLREQAKLEIRRKKMDMIEHGKLPEGLDQMPPLDRALFIAIHNDFDGFKLNYQPILDTEGRWVGAEALARWESREFGMVMPNDFIAIAEKYEIMELLGKWILKEACTRCKLWNKELSEEFFVSVNFTLNQVSGEIFMDHILDTITEVKVNPKNLVLEISNGGEITELDMAQKKLSAIKTFGVRVAIDNFGTAKSSTDVLYKLPVNFVKIDRSHVGKIDRDEQSVEFIKNIKDIAQTQDFKVCAEGVEEAEHVEKLKELGIDYMQGYFFSRPIPAEQLELLYQQTEQEQTGGGQQ